MRAARGSPYARPLRRALSAGHAVLVHTGHFPAGAVPPNDDLEVLFVVRPPQDVYPTSTRNGIRSRKWQDHYGYAVEVAAVNPCKIADIEERDEAARREAAIEEWHAARAERAKKNRLTTVPARRLRVARAVAPPRPAPLTARAWHGARAAGRDTPAWRIPAGRRGQLQLVV